MALKHEMGLTCWDERRVIQCQYLQGTLMVCTHLEGKLVDKSTSFGDVAACQYLPQTHGPHRTERTDLQR